MYNRIELVSFNNNIISVKFNDGKVVSYDIRDFTKELPLLKKLEEKPSLFENGRKAPDGSRVIFNDEIDITCEELYENGRCWFWLPVRDIKMRVGNMLSYKRDEVGMTQEQLAKKAGISQTLINKIEEGMANPSIKTLEKLANGLGLRVEILLK